MVGGGDDGPLAVAVLARVEGAGHELIHLLQHVGQAVVLPQELVEQRRRLLGVVQVHVPHHAQDGHLCRIVHRLGLGLRLALALAFLYLRHISPRINIYIDAVRVTDT